MCSSLFFPRAATELGMPKKPVTFVPQIAELAELLIEDIAKRSLGAGDRYLSTAEASKFLGVSSDAANRALQLLERRQVISRQQRRGAFILELPDDNKVLPLHRVHFLVHPLYLRTEGLGNDQILIGMQRQLPGVHVQISFIPQGDELSLVQQLIGQSLGSKTTDGFVLVRSSCETQRLVAGSGLPAVVFGTVHPGIDGLASLDRDMAGIGSELTRWVLELGHSKVAYLGRQIIYPGDHLTMDSITRELAAAGLPADSLVVRGMSSDTTSCVAGLTSVLTQANAPRALICRTHRIAEKVVMAIEQIGEKLSSFAIAVCDCYSTSERDERFAYAEPVENDEQQGEHLAKLLLSQITGSKIKAEHVVVPIKLKAPKGK